MKLLGVFFFCNVHYYHTLELSLKADVYSVVGNSLLDVGYEIGWEMGVA